MRVLAICCYLSISFFSFCSRPKTVLKSESGPKPEATLTRNGTDSKPDLALTGNDPEPVKIDGNITIDTKNTAPSDLVIYAQSLTGVPYKYASSDPRQGFDCSGFITYVFNHFNIAVPRSSIGFANVDREIKLRDTKPGDLILFTGTDSTNRAVGHMGIITSAPGEEVKFIHSTSGKAYSVTTTPLNPHYQGRFVKALRIFKQNED